MLQVNPKYSKMLNGNEKTPVKNHLPASIFLLQSVQGKPQETEGEVARGGSALVPQPSLFL